MAQSEQNKAEKTKQKRVTELHRVKTTADPSS